LLGIIIRIAYVNYFGSEVYVNYYTHDTPNHIQYIKFVAENLSLPEVDKGLEYPQQPLYYIITGITYRFFNYFISSDQTILRMLVWLSAFFSIGALIFVYSLAKKITDSIWVQSFITGLFSFTPAIVYQAGMLNNDSFLTFLATGTFFFLVAFIKNEKTKNIILAIIFAVLTVFTKISGGILLIIILSTLIYKYGYKKDQKTNYKISAIIYLSFLIGFLCFGAYLYRAYIPSAGGFRFVESYVYEGQQTNPTHISYFLNFNFSEFLKEGQAFVYGNEHVARNFPTFLYGSFLFGEYSYTNITNIYPFIKILMQLIILLGLLFPLGIIINLFYIKKWNTVDYISAFGSIINLGLIIFFLFRYPSVCNSDFRYLSPMFSGLIILSGMGLYRFAERLGKLKFIIPVLCFSLISLEFFWIAGRIAIKIFMNI